MNDQPTVALETLAWDGNENHITKWEGLAVPRVAQKTHHFKIVVAKLPVNEIWKNW
jgi:hypothetical protein